jgi:hypothetical protein
VTTRRPVFGYLQRCNTMRKGDSIRPSHNSQHFGVNTFARLCPGGDSTGFRRVCDLIEERGGPI